MPASPGEKGVFSRRLLLLKQAPWLPLRRPSPRVAAANLLLAFRPGRRLPRFLLRQRRPAQRRGTGGSLHFRRLLATHPGTTAAPFGVRRQTDHLCGAGPFGWRGHRLHHAAPAFSQAAQGHCAAAPLSLADGRTGRADPPVSHPALLRADGRPGWVQAPADSPGGMVKHSGSAPATAPLQGRNLRSIPLRGNPG